MVQYCKYSRYSLSRVESWRHPLFFSWNVLIKDETVKRLRLRWTLCPAFLIVRPWFMTWTTKVALMLSEIMVLAWPLWPHPPLSLYPPPPLPLALPASMLAKLSKWLNWGLFVAGWLVFSCVSKCFQVCVYIFSITNVCCISNRCVFPMVPWDFHFWTKCLMYEIVCSV